MDDVLPLCLLPSLENIINILQLSHQYFVAKCIMRNIFSLGCKRNIVSYGQPMLVYLPVILCRLGSQGHTFGQWLRVSLVSKKIIIIKETSGNGRISIVPGLKSYYNFQMSLCGLKFLFLSFVLLFFGGALLFSLCWKVCLTLKLFIVC